MTQSLPVVVVKGSGPSLVGRGWIKALGVDWQGVNKVTELKETLQGHVDKT